MVRLAGRDSNLLGLSRLRRIVVRQASGKVLEVAVGTGKNLSYYPRDCRIIALDLSSQILKVARDRAAELSMPVSFFVADAEVLPFRDRHFRYGTLVALDVYICESGRSTSRNGASLSAHRKDLTAGTWPKRSRTAWSVAGPTCRSICRAAWLSLESRTAGHGAQSRVEDRHCTPVFLWHSPSNEAAPGSN